MTPEETTKRIAGDCVCAMFVLGTVYDPPALCWACRVGAIIDEAVEEARAEEHAVWLRVSEEAVMAARAEERALEREVCARLADEIWLPDRSGSVIAAAIRARGKAEEVKP